MNNFVFVQKKIPETAHIWPGGPYYVVLHSHAGPLAYLTLIGPYLSSKWNETALSPADSELAATGFPGFNTRETGAASHHPPSPRRRGAARRVDSHALVTPPRREAMPPPCGEAGGPSRAFHLDDFCINSPAISQSRRLFGFSASSNRVIDRSSSREQEERR